MFRFGLIIYSKAANAHAELALDVNRILLVSRLRWAQFRMVFRLWFALVQDL